MDKPQRNEYTCKGRVEDMIFKKFKRKQMDQKQVAVGYDNLPKHGSSNEYYKNTVKNLGGISGRILDIGCGYGDLLLELKRQNKNVIARLDRAIQCFFWIFLSSRKTMQEDDYFDKKVIYAIMEKRKK